jgi:hypothetical protein
MRERHELYGWLAISLCLVCANTTLRAVIRGESMTSGEDNMARLCV